MKSASGGGALSLAGSTLGGAHAHSVQAASREAMSVRRCLVIMGEGAGGLADGRARSLRSRA